LQFGVTLASVIPAASYGETEPNDNFIAADPLAGASISGGSSMVKPIRTGSIPRPLQPIRISWSLSRFRIGSTMSICWRGKPAIWNISVRDAAGNVFANYNTNVMGAIDSYDKDRETYYSMTYSVTAGLVGSYYIVVKPVDGTI
jgi:hypothetical protein